MKKITRRIAEGKEEFYCVFAVSFKSCYSTDVMTLTSEVIQWVIHHYGETIVSIRQLRDHQI